MGYDVKDTISLNYSPTIMQCFVIKNAFISVHQMAFRVLPIVCYPFVPVSVGEDVLDQLQVTCPGVLLRSASALMHQCVYSYLQS